MIPEYLRWYDAQAAAPGRGYNALISIVKAIGAEPRRIARRHGAHAYLA